MELAVIVISGAVLAAGAYWFPEQRNLVVAAIRKALTPPRQIAQRHHAASGNIRTIADEADPPDASEDIHLFPQREPPETRFEEFNWRLFIYTDVLQPLRWNDTVLSDAPTIVEGGVGALDTEVRRRLRPAYPVILDRYGWWSAASERMERTPDYKDAVVDAYLRIPADRRPVVISWNKPDKEAGLVFLRYGFEDFTLTAADIDFNHTLGLSITFNALLGSRQDWHWFSVARLRARGIAQMTAAQLRAHFVELAVRAEVEAAAAATEEEYPNEFDRIFRRRRAIPVRATPAPVSPVPDSDRQVAEPADGEPYTPDLAVAEAASSQAESNPVEVTLDQDDFADIDADLLRYRDESDDILNQKIEALGDALLAEPMPPDVTQPENPGRPLDRPSRRRTRS